MVRSNNNTILFDEPQQNYMKNLLKDKIRQLFGVDIYGNIIRIDNALKGLKVKLTTTKKQFDNTKNQTAITRYLYGVKYLHN